MKARLVAFVGVFCIALLIASGAYADKPDKPSGGKPGGGRDKTRAECIVFADNVNDHNSEHVYLEGGQDCAIEGCCPNAGPWPQYKMTLHNVRYTSAFGLEEALGDEPVLGYLFMNGYGRNAPYEGWKIQFWTCDYQARRPVGGDFFLLIRGGTEVPQGKKSKVSVIEFLNEEDATLWVYHDENPDCYWFENDDSCEPCLDVQTGCDPRNDPDCQYPCWIEQTLENVSFVIVRTADLTYASSDLGITGITCPDIPCSFSP